MSFKRFISYLLFSLLLISSLNAQNDIPVGSWRLHLSYHNTQSLAISEDKVYAASRDGLFYFDKSDNSINIISNLDELSDNQMGEIVYSETHKTLIISYRNGNIDLIKEDEIINIRSVLNSTFQDKTVNHIYLDQDIAYISTNFGVVELDINNIEIKDTYSNIGAEGSEASVFDLTIGQDSMFIATDQGLMVAAMSSNKLDFRSWRIIDNNGQISNLAYFDNQVFYGVDNDRLYTYSSGVTNPTVLVPGIPFYDLSASDNNLIVCAGSEIQIIDKQLNPVKISGENVNTPRQAMFDTDGVLWFAGATKGLVSVENNEFQSYFPSSILIPSIFKFININNKILAVPGGFTEGLTEQNILGSFSVFENGLWTNYTSQSVFSGATEIPQISDLNNATYVSASREVYISSFQDGILRWNTVDDAFSVINAPPLVNVSGNTAITGLNADSENNIWVSNLTGSNSSPSIHRLSPEGSWESFTFNVQGGNIPLDIVIDNAGHKWVKLGGNNGILVFKSQSEFKRLTSQENFGNLPSDKVNALVLDKEGSIWVGTDDGVTEFFAPEFIFDEVAVNASEPRFENKPLLDGEQVTAIAIDGGNRKWIGTVNGIWLFSADGSELIENFTTANSPLLSNNIIDIIVHPVSGEVFIGTANGIISYRGTSTEGTATHQNVKIFPNPVRPGYAGQVSISGLASNATVKITDISGRLVWQTQAAGGTAIWNANALNGARVNTGVYLVYSINENNLDTFVGKIAVVE